ncbi:MAG: ABC transporter permease subunit [Anaplasmataceae bacterium]|nr:ABC transporter permease subunit [Anaplasmataceae bacterium]
MLSIKSKNIISARLKRRRLFDIALHTSSFISILILGSFLLLIGANLVHGIYNSLYFSELLIKVDEKNLENDLNNKNYIKIINDGLKIIHNNHCHKVDSNLLFNYSAVVNLRNNPNQIMQNKNLWIPTGVKVDSYFKKQSTLLNDKNIINCIDNLKKNNLIRNNFNLNPLKNPDSRIANIAGITSSLCGSLITILIAMIPSVIIGVLTGIFLEKFMPKGKIATFVSILINNLASTPSIIYAVFGLSVYINIFNLPRSAPITGGLTLATMALPIIIIHTRQALNYIPKAITNAALSLGASKIQTVFHHVVPCAIPYIANGVILAMARILGESAPLLLIGMSAFISDIPHSIYSPATVIPLQIYIWNNNPDYYFHNLASIAIAALFIIILLLNMVANHIKKIFKTK